MITVAKNAGFCFGVSRAVETVEKCAGEGKTVVTLGPIIHNRHAVEHFEKMGVGVITSPEEAVPGQTVIIRSHGVTRQVYEELEKRCGDLYGLFATDSMDETKINELLTDYVSRTLQTTGVDGFLRHLTA